MERVAWFVLVDASGSVLGPRARVRLSDSTCVADSQDAVKDACPNLFTSVDAHRLQIYANKAAFDAGTPPQRR